MIPSGLHAGRPPARRLLASALLGLVLAALPGRCQELLTPPGRPDTGARPPRTHETLAVELSRLISQPDFARASWGISVQEAATGTTLFATNDHRLLKPASNAKLFTAALALETFGPDHRFRTELLPTGPLDRRGTLHGDLVVRGQGDFSFAARFHKDHPDQALEAIVDALSRAGVRRIGGAIVADESWFRGAPLGSGWTWDDLQNYYGAPLGALNADDNTVDLVFHPGNQPGDPLRLEVTPPTSLLKFDLSQTSTVATNGPRTLGIQRAPASDLVLCSGTLPVGGAPAKDAISVPDPGLHFVHRLTETLKNNGIPVHQPPRRLARSGDSTRGTPHPYLPRLAVESPPLAELLAGMLKPSQNLYAQMLLLQVGMKSLPTTSAETPEQAGLRTLHSALGRIGIPSAEVLLDDGSGLSRSSLVTADAIVRLLRHLDASPHRSTFLAALPVAGVDGTLKNRLRTPETAGNLRAKTGALRFVSALSGFVTNAGGQRLVFSVLLNAYEPSIAGISGRDAVDAVATALARSRTEDAP